MGVNVIVCVSVVVCVSLSISEAGYLCKHFFVHFSISAVNKSSEGVFRVSKSAAYEECVCKVQCAAQFIKVQKSVGRKIHQSSEKCWKENSSKFSKVLEGKGELPLLPGKIKMIAAK